MSDFPIDKELKELWQDGLQDEVRRTAIAFLLLIVIFCAVNLLLPDLRQQAMEQILLMMSGKDVVTPDGQLSFLGLFSNNLSACLSILIYGLIPFARLSALALGTNAALLGVLAAYSIAEGTALSFLAGILPHGLFEFPALILAFAMSLYVCGQTTRRCKKDKSAHSLLECLMLISKLLFLVLLPLLLISAAIEAWVTPLILLLFQ